MNALLLSIIGPALGGLISFAIWQAKVNGERVEKGIASLHSCVHSVERKVEDMAVDLAKNYCTRDELQNHIDKEEDWHSQHHEEVKELRREFTEQTTRLSHDVSEIRDMQWKMTLDRLDNNK